MFEFASTWIVGLLLDTSIRYTLITPLETSILQREYHFHIKRTRLSADEITPVRLYRQLRTYFSPSVLLESNNFTQARDTHSIIGVDPLLEVEVRKGWFSETYFPAAQANRREIEEKQVFEAFENVVSKVTYSEDPGDIDGFFGFTSFDAYRFAEPKLKNMGGHTILPDLHYFFFRFLLVFDHFHEHIDIIEFVPKEQGSMTKRLLKLFKKPLGNAEQFSCIGEEKSSLTDKAYETLVSKGKDHCDRGDTFQVVLSREFEQQFEGDDFNVYRQLRRLNPSPYWFLL